MQSHTAQTTRSQIAWLAALVVFLIVYAAPSLWFGILWIDDFEIMRASIWQPKSAEKSLFWRFLYWRPVTMLSFSLTAGISDTIFAQRFASLVLYALCAVLVFRLVGHSKYWPLIVLAAFLHPSFIFPLTWIAQRNDLLLIVFAILALANIDRRRGLAYLALSDMAKAPFGFHNLLFAYHAWRRRPDPAVVAASLVLLAYVIFGAYVSYLAVNLENEVKHGAYLITGGDLTSMAIKLLSRGMKFLENWFLVFVPFPATFGTSLLVPCAVLYLVVWVVAVREAFRGLDRSRPHVYLLVTAVLMSLPLAFGTGVRTVGPVVVFAYAGFFAMVSPTRLIGAVLVGLVALNLTGSLLNYRATDTGCYDPATDAATASANCLWQPVPISRWNEERQHIVDDLVRRVIKELGI